MAGRNDPNKQALLKNRPKIVQNLENPDDVAAYLYSISLFTEEMQAAVVQEPEREKKNRKLLDTLNYRGKNAAKALYDAFLETLNEELAELLAPYVKQIQNEDNKFSPEKWPPEFEEQKKMASDPVKRITDLKSPHYIHHYTSSTVYKMRNRIRGKVFIINNETFDDGTKLSFRKGSNVDANNLECLFTQLQFEVVIEKDKSAKAMIDFLTKERDKVKNWNDMECVVLIIMSHGNTDGIYGADGKLTKLKVMTDIFDSSQCPGLNGKPRLVFVQACRGTNTETRSTGHGIQVKDGADQENKVVEPMKAVTLADREQDVVDAVPSKETEVNETTVHLAADFLIANATPEGTSAYRHVDVGSWFLNAIVWTFKYHAHKEEISQLLIMVNNLVSQGRTNDGLMTVSEVKSTLRKKFFFFPGVYDNPPKFV